MPHKLDDNRLVSPTIYRRFRDEAAIDGGDGRYFAVLERSNGEWFTEQMGPEGNPEELGFAFMLLPKLNKELHHDGAWVMIFTGYRPPRIPMLHGEFSRLTLIWIDADGDPGFSIDYDQGLKEAVSWGWEAWGNHCEESWKLWHIAMRQVLPKQALYRKALGETPPSVH